MPNRRRRKLSTAMSAVAALAVASPFAAIAVSDLVADSEPAPQKRQFVQAAGITDLASEVVSALQSSLSQFGIVVPNIPSSILGPDTTALSPPMPGGLTTDLMTPGVSTDLTTPGLTPPAVSVPSVTTTTPALGVPSVTSAPLLPGMVPPDGLTPALTSPVGASPGLTAPPSEVPITAPVAMDPLAGTYPILGDPLLAAPPAVAAPTGGGGLLGGVSETVSELGAPVIDVLKGMVMGPIMQAIQSGVPVPPPDVAPPPPPPPPTG